MTNCRIVNLNGAVIGWLNETGDRVLNRNGQVLFFRSGNQLTSAKDGARYTVWNDGRIFNSRNAQTGFFYGFADLSRAAGRPQPSASRPAQPPKTVPAAPAAKAVKTNIESKSSSPLLKIGAFAIAVVLLAYVVFPALFGIKGTWEAYSFQENGVSYSRAAFEEHCGRPIDYEINFSKGGVCTIRDSGETTQGKWYKSSGSTYVLSFYSAWDWLNDDGGSSMEAKLKNGKLVLEDEDFKIMLKRK